MITPNVSDTHYANSMQNHCILHTDAVYSYGMAQKNLQVRLDAGLKRKAEAVFQKIGLDTPTAIRIFFTKVAAVGGIPFPLGEDIDYYTPAQIKALDRMAEKARKGKLFGPFTTAEEMIKDLHSRL